MGVSGLHPQLKEISIPVSLEKYRGKTLAVDTYSWLHKSTISCAQELCLNQPTQKYVSYIIKKINMLRHFGVEPYMVFDGASLPTKAATAKERKERREEAQAKADEYMKKGNKKLAWKEFMKAAAVTSQMSKSVMVELDRMNVKYVVAPYEADPQMVYLEKKGYVDGIISEDSDLLIFGCRTLITKLNDFGECIEISKSNFSKVTTISGLDSFTPQQLRLVAMLSGCDYTKGVPGVGLKTAFNLVKKYNQIDRVLMALRAEGKKLPPEGFEVELIKADLAFQYQKVFNPKDQTLETLNEYPEPFDFDMELVEQCCGVTFDAEIHVGISKGKLHPNTHEVLISREQNITSLKSKSFTSEPKISTVARTKSVGSTSSRRMVAPRGRIDSFFSVQKSTKITTTDTTSDQQKLQIEAKAEVHTEQVSPDHKRVRTLLTPKENPPKLVGTFSKFFKSPAGGIPTPRSTFDADITGDSEISDVSSPFRYTKSTSDKVDTNNVLGNLTDDDIDTQTQSDHKMEENRDDSQPPESPSSKISKQPAVGDFDLDDDEDDIEESPVKSLLPSGIHFNNNRDEIKQLLRDTFSFRPGSKEKFQVPKALQKLSAFENASTISIASAESSHSDSSFDLNSEEFHEVQKHAEVFTNIDMNKSFESISSKRTTKSKLEIKNSSLSRFAYK
ncbi:Rad2 nuclease [Yamadazyma tenuis]|uniref:PIN domain-like protein n=1 Tax=Candida tenuis (strain ATCC 10573 / BCRC 21748 / CBS 615 / JCM 9827 / NBRC 10315 / NRRL Y-1498 / VKM Y-70) TaxID=590646 RepID=G3B5G9_CANTC|nr:PIN domain-like protein [Yamadazyma tenuis ATCC 10573]EGV63221.1 PIN domain-like protein [Yamadazyma tenuis ATCC 10573]WEJ96958.1 Rad2 nuclease [Yamadazyma tenuis]